MNGRFQMQGGKNWFLPKEMNANRFFWDSHWLEIWSNHFYPSMGPNGVSVAMDSGIYSSTLSPWIEQNTDSHSQPNSVRLSVSMSVPYYFFIPWDRLAGWRGGWGSIFWKTREIRLPSTVAGLKKRVSKHQLILSRTSIINIQ